MSICISTIFLTFSLSQMEFLIVSQSIPLVAWFNVVTARFKILIIGHSCIHNVKMNTSEPEIPQTAKNIIIMLKMTLAMNPNKLSFRTNGNRTGIIGVT